MKDVLWAESYKAARVVHRVKAMRFLAGEE